MRTKSMFTAVMAMAVMASVASAEVLLLSDDFNTADTTDLNSNLATRQDGSLAPVTWSKSTEVGGAGTISDNQMRVSTMESTDTGYHVSLDHDFTDSAITTGGGFRISFDFTSLEANWSALSLGRTETSRISSAAGQQFVTDAATDYGFLLGTTGNWQVFSGSDQEGSGSSGVSGTNAIDLVVETTGFTVGTAAKATLSMNGDVQHVHEFTWDADGTNYLSIESWRDGVGLVDNFSISAIPEPASGLLLLGATAFLGLLRKKLYG